MTVLGRYSAAYGLLDQDPDFLAEVIERYENGEKLRELAAGLDVPTSILADRLRRGGATMRPKGRIPKPRQGEEVS